MFRPYPIRIFNDCHLFANPVVTSISGHLVQRPKIFEIAFLRNPNILYLHRRDILGIEFLEIIRSPQEFETVQSLGELSATDGFPIYIKLKNLVFQIEFQFELIPLPVHSGAIHRETDLRKIIIHDDPEYFLLLIINKIDIPGGSADYAQNISEVSMMVGEEINIKSKFILLGQTQGIIWRNIQG